MIDARKKDKYSYIVIGYLIFTIFTYLYQIILYTYGYSVENIINTYIIVDFIGMTILAIAIICAFYPYSIKMINKETFLRVFRNIWIIISKFIITFLLVLISSAKLFYMDLVSYNQQTVDYMMGANRELSKIWSVGGYGMNEEVKVMNGS
ncbi:MAG: hypothetical protein ACI4E1_00670 [Lachnospira sp.]